MRLWTIGGCAVSAAAVVALACVGLTGFAPALHPIAFVAGAANGAFSIAAIGTMMSLADTGREARAGVRMGLWGAAQALAFALGGLLGTAGSDLARVLAGATAPALAYAGVFAGVAALFVIAAGQAAHVFETRNGRSERAADLVGASAAAIARR
jgi:BCD family chlorophyll transporter-like MFS transporter